MANTSNKATTQSQETAQLMQANLGLAEMQLARQRLAIEKGKLDLASVEQKRRYESEAEEREMRRQLSMQQMNQQGQQFQASQKQALDIAQMEQRGANQRTEAELAQRTGFYKASHENALKIAQMEIEAAETRESKTRKQDLEMFHTGRIDALEAEKRSVQREARRGEREIEIQQQLARVRGDRQAAIQLAAQTAQKRLQDALEAQTVASRFDDTARLVSTSARDMAFTAASVFTMTQDPGGPMKPITKSNTVYDVAMLGVGTGLLRRNPKSGKWMGVIDPDAFQRAMDLHGRQGKGGGFLRNTIEDPEALAEVNTRLRANGVEFSPEITLGGYEGGNVVGDVVSAPFRFVGELTRNTARMFMSQTGMANPEVEALGGVGSTILLLSGVFGQALQSTTSEDELRAVQNAIHLSNQLINNPESVKEVLNQSPEMKQDAMLAMSILQSTLEGLAFEGSGVEGEPTKQQSPDDKDTAEVRKGISATRSMVMGMIEKLSESGVKTPEQMKANVEGILSGLRESPEAALRLAADRDWRKAAESIGVDTKILDRIIEKDEEIRVLEGQRATADYEYLDDYTQELESQIQQELQRREEVTQ